MRLRSDPVFGHSKQAFLFRSHHKNQRADASDNVQSKRMELRFLLCAGIMSVDDRIAEQNQEKTSRAYLVNVE